VACCDNARMDVIEAIDTRTSALKLGDPAPSQEQINRILQSAIRAPDHGRLTPWRFIVLQQEGQRVLGEAIARAFKRNVPEATEEQLEAQRNKVRRAPLVIVVAASVRKGHKVPEIEQQLAVAAGVQNMILTAQALGLGALWKTGAPAYDADVKAALGLISTDHIVAFLYIGTPVAAVPSRPNSLEGLVRWL
jgi:nitroreductase